MVSTLALAQDNAFGQPLESQLRSCLLARWFCEAAGYDAALTARIHWVALLRYLGCTGHAHEVATVFGDEIAIRAQTLVHDAANPAEVMRDVIAFATARYEPQEREQVAEGLRAGAHDWAVHNFASGCEVADMLAARLGMPHPVREALSFTFERWNGGGFPQGTAGAAIPLAMRVVHLTHDMEALARHFSPAAAVEAARERSGRTYDPEIAAVFVAQGSAWLERLAKVDPWDAVLEIEPAPHRLLQDDDLDAALLVVSDFIDLKSPWMAGHSRRCADLAARAAEVAALPPDDVTRVRRAALVHEFGTTAVPNSIWDKPGPLTRAELDRVELHVMLTEQMLRRSPALARLNSVAAAHHERADGSGYHKGLRRIATDPGAAILAATDVYVGLTSDRADRPAASTPATAAHLRLLAKDGALDSAATDAVLVAAGHGDAGQSSRRTAGLSRDRPGGLTRREVEVLRLATRGLTTAQIAGELVISAKTADHHIQNVYAKIGVSARPAAALWALEHLVV